MENLKTYRSHWLPGDYGICDAEKRVRDPTRGWRYERTRLDLELGYK